LAKVKLRKETLVHQQAITAKERELTEREATLDRTVQERVKAQRSEFEQQAKAAATAAVSVELEDLKRHAAEKDQRLAMSQRLS